MLAAGAVLAASPVTTTLTVQMVTVDAKGKESLTPADKVKPGDVLLYTVVVTNTGDTAITAIEPSLPIPSGTIYLLASALPAAVRASTDGTLFEAVPLKRKVKQADGTTKVVDVPAEQYRFLKWRFNRLEAHAAVTVSARVTVANVITVPAKSTTR